LRVIDMKSRTMERTGSIDCTATFMPIARSPHDAFGTAAVEDELSRDGKHFIQRLPFFPDGN
jgi:hypothetical protein